MAGNTWVDTNTRSFIATAAMAKHARVKLDGNGNNAVELAGAGDLGVGTLWHEALKANDPVSVHLNSAAGTQVMIANGVIAEGGNVEAAIGGKVAPASVGTVVGMALTAAAADGDYIEVLPV